jgi:hypothetical protein
MSYLGLQRYTTRVLPRIPTTDRADAAASAAASAASASAASTSATNAATSETNAAASSASAANSALILGAQYTFSTTTADADPGAGLLRLSNATQNASTVIRIDLTDKNGADLTAFLDTFDDSTSGVKGQIRLVKSNDATKFLIFNITSLASPAGYRNVTVANIGFSAASPFANTDPVSIVFTRSGDAGGVSDGDKGDITVSASGATFTIDALAVTTGKIADANVTTLKIADNNVTLAKLVTTATGVLLGRWNASTGNYENLTIGTSLQSTSGTLNVATAADPRGTQTIYCPAGAMIARTTNGAGTSTLETTTNKNCYKSLDFDTTTQEFAQFSVGMPKGWNEGTITFQVLWSHPSTTTNFGVVFGLSAVALSDADAQEAAFGTVVTVTDTGGATNTLYQSPVSGAVTIAGTPAEGDMVLFQLQRNPADGGDTLAVDARVIGIRIFYTTNAATDA